MGEVPLYHQQPAENEIREIRLFPAPIVGAYKFPTYEICGNFVGGA